MGGADENRTRIICLEDRGFTTKLQPRIRPGSDVDRRCAENGVQRWQLEQSSGLRRLD
ncbi:phage-related replication protein [Microbacterium sp. TS-1]|nr:phage-related replication protein [Microbacterium sp. TS-1]